MLPNACNAVAELIDFVAVTSYSFVNAPTKLAFHKAVTEFNNPNAQVGTRCETTVTCMQVLGWTSWEFV
jgi:hypothetical protein